VLSAAAACGGDRRPGAASVDTAGTPVTDTTAARTDDTAPVAIPESSTVGARDTTSAPTPPVPQRARAPKPTAAPRPRRPPAGMTADTAAPSTPRRDSTAGDTATAAAAPQRAESTQAPSGQTSSANAPLRDPYHQAPVDTVPQLVYDGWKQFNLNCARCHGEDVQGTTIAPHLIVSLRPDGPINTKELFVQTVCAGRPAKGMPAWCALGMDMEKINAIYSYVKGRSEGKIHPGRPAVRQQG
jgi:mono/diheme cytochrome c family protein